MEKQTKGGWLWRVGRFYWDGFRQMGPLGRRLWMVILIKLFIMFVILRIFFFPDLLGRLENDRQRSDSVIHHWMQVLPDPSE